MTGQCKAGANIAANSLSTYTLRMETVLRLEKNTLGRDFAVGDIHGCFSLLEKALNAVSFDPAVDRVICVGDLVDRGPESNRALEFLEKSWFYTVRGDHEDIIPQDIEEMNRKGKDAMRNEYQRNGMDWLLELDEAEQEAFCKAFQELPYVIEVVLPDDSIAGFIHAEVPENLTWQDFTRKLAEGDQQTIQTALRGRARIKKAHENGYNTDEGVKGINRLFTGHSLAAYRGACRMGNWYLIDTGAVARVLEKSDGFFTDIDPKNFHLTLAEITADADTLSETRPSDNNNPYHVINAVKP